MTAKEVLQAVNEIDGQDIGKGTRIVLEALVKDGEEMSKRMTSLENKVDKIDNTVEAIKKSMDDLKDAFSQRQNGWKFLGELIKEAKFWYALIILIVLAYGVSIADLKGLLP